MLTQLYRLGDLVTITGFNSSIDFPNGDSHYYGENDSDGDSIIDSISESYYASQDFNDGGWKNTDEYYTYFLDESTLRVSGVSYTSNAGICDNLDRYIEFTPESQIRADDGYFSLSKSTITNTFVSPESRQLSTSLEIYSSSDSNGYSQTTTRNSSYAYTDSNADTYYYSSKRSVSAYDDKSDGTIDSVSYNLERYDWQGNSYESSSVGVTLDSQGRVQGSSRSTYTSTYSSFDKFSNSSSDIYAADWDGDGIINHQSSSSYSYSYRNGKSTSSSEYIYKNDYNEDGLAGDIYQSTTKSRNGKATTTDYDYDLSTNVNKNLSITKSTDKDGDGVFDSVKRRLVSADIDDSLLSMGGHVATLQDTFI